MYNKKRLGKIETELSKRLDYVRSTSGINPRKREEVIAQICKKYRLQIIPYSRTTLLAAEPGSLLAIKCEILEGKEQRVVLSIVESPEPWTT